MKEGKRNLLWDVGTSGRWRRLTERMKQDEYGGHILYSCIKIHIFVHKIILRGRGMWEND
jgi:hypothetical protein